MLQHKRPRSARSVLRFSGSWRSPYRSGVKLSAQILVLMSVWLGSCGGEDQPSALQDFDTPVPTRSGSTASGTGGAGNTSPPGAGDGSGGSTRTEGGSSGSYIPTPMETGPTAMDPVEPMNTGGQAGTASTAPVEPCSLGTWLGNFSARSAAELQQLSGYTHVSGRLYVGVSSSGVTTDVTSLAALSCLEQVDGEVHILENHNLRDLAGLERLALVGGNFTVSTNAQIATLEALTGLVVTDVLHIRANPQLTTLGDGILSAAVMYINENPALPQCLAEALALDLGLTCNCENNAEGGTCQ